MCGRYTFTETPDPALVVQAEGQSLELKPRFNIAPTQLSLISPLHDPKRMYFYQWGLIPHWAKDAKIGYKLINARAETLWEKPSFRESAKYQRCIVWGDGFYEWKKEGRGKQAYFIGLKDKKLFPMAGISASWTSPSGTEVLSYSIITTEPNELMEDIHNRMPVILPKEEVNIWMDASLGKQELQRVLKPLSADFMHAYPVGPEVGKVGNDFKELIKPFTPPPKPLSLFD